MASPCPAAARLASATAASPSELIPRGSDPRRCAAIGFDRERPTVPRVARIPTPVGTTATCGEAPEPQECAPGKPPGIPTPSAGIFARGVAMLTRVLIVAGVVLVVGPVALSPFYDLPPSRLRYPARRIGPCDRDPVQPARHTTRAEAAAETTATPPTRAAATHAWSASAPESASSCDSVTPVPPR